MSMPFDFDSSFNDNELDSPLFDPPPVPRTFQEAVKAWETIRERNRLIREKFQVGRARNVLLRNAAHA